MSGSQHVYEEPGFRHALPNCQVCLLKSLGFIYFLIFLYLLFVTCIHSVLVIFLKVLFFFLNQRMHQHCLRNSRSQNGRQEAQGKLQCLTIF